jgi:hypothetical protein
MSVLLGALVGWWLLLAQQPQQKIPAAGLAQLPPNPFVVTLDVSPQVTTVNSPVVFTAKVSPPPDTAIAYQFQVNGADVKDCTGNSPKCTWVPSQPEEYAVHVVVRFSLGRGAGRRGSATRELFSSRQMVVVTAVTPTPTPTPTVPNPDLPPPDFVPPVITLNLTSDRVVAGQPATFAVSIENGSPFLYDVDMGDNTGSLTRSATEFTYVYERPGPFDAVARFPVGTELAVSRLRVTVEPVPVAPQPAEPPIPESAPPPDFVPPPPPMWPYVLGGLLAIAGLVALARARGIKRSEPPQVQAIPTFHPTHNRTPKFRPKKMKGVSLEIRLVRNLAHVKFSQRVRIRRES